MAGSVITDPSDVLVKMAFLEQLTAQLKRDEGNRLKPYDDADSKEFVKGKLVQGKLTIGIGRNLQDRGIRQREADYMLSNDIDEIEGELHALMPWTEKLDDARRGVLFNMAFQLGIHGLIQFESFLALVHAGNYQSAAAEMMKSRWAQIQAPVRAHRLSVQMVSGEWQ